MYIFEKKIGKLVSLLLVPIAKCEIGGMVVSGDSMVIYSMGELFKLDSKLIQDKWNFNFSIE